jgi:hypothetical protein
MHGSMNVKKMKTLFMTTNFLEISVDHEHIASKSNTAAPTLPPSFAHKVYVSVTCKYNYSGI